MLGVSERSRPLLRPLTSRAGQEYGHIAGALANLGQRLDESVAHTLLRRYDLESAPPQHTMGISRGQFLKLHWGALATSDLGSAEVATREYGLP